MCVCVRVRVRKLMSKTNFLRGNSLYLIKSSFCGIKSILSFYFRAHSGVSVCMIQGEV